MGSPQCAGMDLRTLALHLDTTAPVHQIVFMRLTINLENENYTLAKSLAKSEDCTISTAVNKLIRRAIEPKAVSSKVRWKNGLPFPAARWWSPLKWSVVWMRNSHDLASQRQCIGGVGCGLPYAPSACPSLVWIHREREVRDVCYHPRHIFRLHMRIAADNSAVIAWRMLGHFCANKKHVFWNDAFDYQKVSHQHLHGPAQ